MTRLPDDSALDRLLRAAAEEPEAGAPDIDLGKYRLVTEIGRGGMAVVWEAWDTQLQRRVALKLLTPRAGENRVLRGRFVREAQAAASLHHPNIAAVYDATPDYIAMQLVEGVTLDELDSGDQRLFATLLRSAAEAVHSAHQAGVFHRDLKPSNMMVEAADSASPRLFVMDFGLAKQATMDPSLSQSGQLLGTPSFMAPEQVAGAPVDGRCDVYGLGATLYACLSGSPPFDGDDVVQVLRKITDEEPRGLRKTVDGDLVTIVQKAMAKEVERRYPTALAFAEDLGRWLRHEPITARRPSLGYRLGKLARRRGDALKVGTAVGLIGAVLAAMVLVGERSSRRATERALSLSNTVVALIEDARDARLANHREIHDAKLARAIELCRNLLAEDDVAQGHYLLGYLHFLRKEYLESLSSLDRALELKRDLDEARFLRGLMLLEYASKPPEQGGPLSLVVGHYIDQARQDIKVHERSTLEVRQVDLLYGEARVSLIDGDLATAKNNLRQIVYSLDPYHVEALRTLADLVREEDEAEAIRLGSRAMDLQGGIGRLAVGTPFSPELVPPAVMIPGAGPTVDFEDVTQGPARVLALQALRTMRVAAELQRLGQIREALEEWRRAIDTHDAALELDDQLAGAYTNRGVARTEVEKLLRAQGRVMEATTDRMRAMGDFQRAYALEPQQVAVTLNLAAAWQRHAIHLQGTEMMDQATEAMASSVGYYRDALDDEGPGVLHEIARARLRDAEEQLARLRGR